MNGSQPHPGVHRPWMFICSATDPDASVVALAEHPAVVVASRLLEDVGAWYDALHSVQKTAVPPAVTEALGALHEAACGWADWTAGHRNRHGEEGQHDQQGR
ncbi:hypothetical protein [Streptomyces ipomoeae]|uniref:hypothetical protein n=1 Tax=Streptomyces ipomoeae TaxID=103232 RepID=UPI0011472AD5|nr:hypothetical protein [Streptomyces ipomoeae]TQE33105.1 hypothetical protein Sipo7851_21645 [Streptomyces ipomoeae]